MRLAIVGCGQISHAHIGALQTMPQAEIVAVCDRDQWRARDLTRLAKGVRHYHDLAVLLEQEHPDVVHILTPPDSHAALAVQAIQAGCHVFVEKPMALSTQEADSMITAAREKDVKLCTNHNYLFKPSLQKAKRWVESGIIGTVVYVDAYYGSAGEASSYGGAGRSHWAWRLPGSTFTNFLPHLIYIQMAFLGEIESVAGVTLAAKKGEPASEMTVLLQGNGATGNMSVSLRAKPYAKFVDIYGTKGIVHVDLVREIATIHKESGLPRMFSKAIFSLEDSVQLAFGTAGNIVNVAMGKMKNMPELPVLFHQFYDSILNDREPPVPGEQGRKMIEIMEKIWAKSSHASEQPAVRFSASATPAPRTDAEWMVTERGMPGTVLVTGATGRLGCRLVSALARSGVNVVALVRDPGRASLELENIAQIICGDVRDLASVETAMRDIAVVYHCAAITRNRVPSRTHQEINILGTENVLKAARSAGVRRVIHLSTVLVYGFSQPHPDRPVDEATPYPSSLDKWAYYMRSKIEAEILAFQYWRDFRVPITVLRLGILYGTGGQSRGLAQFGPFRLMIGSGNNYLPLTYVDNAVDALLLAAMNPQAIGQAYNIVDEPQVRMRDAAHLNMAISGERVRLVPLPLPVLSGIASLLEFKYSRAGSDTPPQISNYIIRSDCRNIRYDTTKARTELGWQPAITLEQGFRASSLASA